MRRFLIGCICVLAFAATVDAQSLNHYDGEYGAPGPGPAIPGPNSITQSTDTSTITAGNSVHCGSGGLHADNSYIRRFLLDADHGIVGAFSVDSVDWAIESATGAAGSQPVEVNLYSIPVGAALTFANLTSIGSSNISVADASLSGISTNVSGVVSDPTTLDLVVEVFTPSGQTAGHGFFIGSNANGETQPSYLAAAACGISEPTATGAIGFPDMQIVMVVNGTEAGEPVPTMGGWALILLAALLITVTTWVLRRRSLHHTV